MEDVKVAVDSMQSSLSPLSETTLSGECRQSSAVSPKAQKCLIIKASVCYQFPPVINSSIEYCRFQDTLLKLEIPESTLHFLFSVNLLTCCSCSCREGELVTSDHGERDEGG